MFLATKASSDLGPDVFLPTLSRLITAEAGRIWPEALSIPTLVLKTRVCMHTHSVLAGMHAHAWQRGPSTLSAERARVSLAREPTFLFIYLQSEEA